MYNRQEVPVKVARTQTTLSAMEEAYRTVGLAILRLVSGVGEEIEHVKNQAILRSVLQHRPVILGYALSTLARRLNEGE